MKNKILLVVMLLLTFFGLAFSGLSSVEVKATTDTVSYDINAINVPRNVISSFPVTYKSVHGNTITWTVQAEQDIITYDEEAHWMVVNRPESGTNSVVSISVTVSDGEKSETKNFEIIVPAGKTAAPKYTITYTNGNDETTETYKLGDPTKVLQAPSAREGYTFDGWYEGETKVEKILVGSARNYNLEARWTKNATPLSEVEGSLSSSTSVYNENAVEVEVTLTYENETLVEDTHYTVSYTKDGNPANEIRGAGNYKVVVTAKAGSGYAGTKEFDYVVTKATYDMSKVTFEDATHVYDGEEKTLVIGGELPEGVTVSYTTNTLTHVGSVEVTASFTGDSDNYKEITSITKTLTITPATYTLSAAGKQIFVGNTLPSWDLKDFQASGLVDGDEVNVSGELFITYKNESGALTPSAAGTYTVSFNGLEIDNDNYQLVVADSTLTIIKTNFSVSVPEGPYVYNGSAHTPEVVVKDGETVLTKDVDYTVSYDDNTNAGTAKVILTAKGTYAGLVMPEATFTISPKEVTLTANNVEYTYGDQAATNGYTVTSENLSENEINLLKPQVAIVVNAVKVTYTENGNYAVTTVDGTVTMNARDITITASDKSSVYGSKLVELTYTITGHTVSQEDLAELAITLTKAEGTDAGTYEITVTATSNAKYNVTPVKGTYTISQLDLTDEEVSATVLGSDFNVQCENNTPSVEVSYNENVVTTYELSYLNNTAAGTAQVVITYTGNYTGTTTLDFVVTETGQAGIDAAALDSNYSQILTGEITELAALSLTINNSTVFWTPSTTAVKVDPETGVVTILRSTEENLDVELVATVKYGTTSTAVVVFNFVIPANKTLENNSVTVTGPVVDLTFTATEISKEDAAQSNYQIKASEEYVSGYDIEFNDGEVSSFDTPLTVKLPIPNEYVNNPNIKLYHVLENDELEAVDAQIVDGYFVFEASKFSPYIIVVEKTYTVTFKNDGVAMGEVQTVKHGQAAEAPTLPTKEGHTSSWDKEFSNIISDLVVNVVYTANTYKLTIDFADGSTPEVRDVVYGTAIELGTPTRDGYEFNGWDGYVATMPATDLTVTAKWTEVVNEEQIVFVDEGYENKTEITTIELKFTTLTFGKGSNSNSPKYYDTGEAVRLYGGNVINITSSKNISKIQLTFASGENENEIIPSLGTMSEDGLLLFTSAANELTLTIAGTSGHRRVASITISYGEYVEPTDLEKLEADMNIITLPEIVEENFDLPLEGEVYGSEISWESNNSAITVNENIASILRTTNDVIVTLTATIKFGEETRTKDFEVTVAKLVENVDITSIVTIENGKVTIPYNAITANGSYIIDLGNDGQVKIIYDGYLDKSAYNEIGLGKTNGAISFIFTDVEVATLFSDVFGQYDNMSCYIGEDNTGLKVSPTISTGSGTVYSYVLTPATTCVYFANLSNYDVAFYNFGFTYGDAARLNVDYNALSLESSYSTNFELTTMGTFGSAIEWSSNNDAIVIDGTNAIVTTSQEDVVVTLTAVISLAEEEPLTKTFEITVIGETANPVTVTYTWTSGSGTISSDSRTLTVDCGDFTIVLSQNTSSSKPVNTYSELRFYQGHILTISSNNGKSILSVKFTDVAGKSASTLTFEEPCKNNYAFSLSNKVFTITASNALESLSFQGNKQIRFTSIEVVLQ